MDERVVRIKKMSDQLKGLPKYATSGSAGIDLQACLFEPQVILPGKTAKIPTGIAVQMPKKDMVGFVFARSGLAFRQGISLANGVGVIDSDYTGEIGCLLHNHSEYPFTIEPGDRVAQLVFCSIHKVRFEVCEELADTDRGSGGFGSTGLSDHPGKNGTNNG